MIVRQVKLTFQREKVFEFLEFFKTIEDQIKNFPGCLHLVLYRDITNINIFFTVSHWNSDEDLENYRSSLFFQSTWTRTKTYFSAAAEARTLIECR